MGVALQAAADGIEGLQLDAFGMGAGFVVNGEDLVDVLLGEGTLLGHELALAQKLDAGSHDIAVLFQGADVPDAEAAQAVDALAAAFPRTETTLIEGGQPVYDYILLLC